MIRRSWMGFLLAGSLCLNVGFLAAYGVQWYRHGHRSRSDWEASFPPEVRTRLDANYEHFRERLAPMQAQVAAERARLLDLLASENPSPAAIADQQARIVTMVDRVVRLVTQHLMDQKRLLTPDQQRLFFDHIRRRVRQHNRRLPEPNEESHK